MTTKQENMPAFYTLNHEILIPYAIGGTRYIRSDIVDGLVDALQLCEMVLRNHYEGIKEAKFPPNEKGIVPHVALRPDKVAMEALTNYNEETNDKR